LYRPFGRRSGALFGTAAAFAVFFDAAAVLTPFVLFAGCGGGSTLAGADFGML